MFFGTPCSMLELEGAKTPATETIKQEDFGTSNGNFMRVLASMRTVSLTCQAFFNLIVSLFVIWLDNPPTKNDYKSYNKNQEKGKKNKDAKLS